MISILSLTFHTPEHLFKEWDIFLNDSLKIMIENLMDVEKYILSEVKSDMVSEGKNTNLLLVFDDGELRDLFLENEFVNLQEHIFKNFDKDILIFKTFLNPLVTKI